MSPHCNLVSLVDTITPSQNPLQQLFYLLHLRMGKVKGQMSRAGVAKPAWSWRERKKVTLRNEDDILQWAVLLTRPESIWVTLTVCQMLEIKVGLTHTSDLWLLSKLWHFLPRQTCWYLDVRFLRCAASTASDESRRDHYKAPFRVSAEGTRPHLPWPYLPLLQYEQVPGSKVCQEDLQYVIHGCSFHSAIHFTLDVHLQLFTLQNVHLLSSHDSQGWVKAYFLLHISWYAKMKVGSISVFQR